MRKSLIICLTLVLALSFFGISKALAGAKIKVSDDTEINLGWRLQVLLRFSEFDFDGNPGFDNKTDVIVRRARFRLGAKIGDYVSTFLQTDQTGTSTVKLIDAFVKFKFQPWIQIIAGRNMAPILRQNLTSSGALMVIDRSSQANKSITWGTSLGARFNTTSLFGSGVGTTPNAVRDTNIVLFGSGPVGDDAGSFKYYIAAGDGVNNASSLEDSLRFTVRGQYNFWDPEPGFYNLSTYLGKKKTLAIGAGFDTQSDVVLNTATGSNSDYTLFTVDAFLDYPLGDGTLTVESAYSSLDLDDFNLAAEGDGLYIHAGYLFADVWQPWIAWEYWGSDAAGDAGSMDAFRFGVSYFIKGHNANVKAGYEIWNSDVALAGSDDSIGTFILGAYVTY